MSEIRYDNLYEKLINGEEKLALVGLGYVGMPIAVEFAKHVKVIGFNWSASLRRRFCKSLE